jgi:hypothetical protein
MIDERDDAAWQHADECARQQQIDAILHAAALRPLDPNEIQILAAEAGVQYLHKPN